MPCAPALVMPNFIPGEVEFVAEFGRFEQRDGGFVEGQAGLGEFIVIEVNESVILLIKAFLGLVAK